MATGRYATIWLIFATSSWLIFLIGPAVTDIIGLSGVPPPPSVTDICVFIWMALQDTDRHDTLNLS